MNIKKHRKRSIGTLVVLLFVLSFSITPALLFSDLNFGPGPTDEKQNPNLSTNYLFKGTTYTFNLDDFYDDEDLYKVWTGAKFQTEAFNGTTLEWSGVVNNDTVTPVDNDETQYGDPSNINMIEGSYDYTDNMKVNDDSSTNFTSTHTDGYIREMPNQWDNFTFTEGSGITIEEIETINAEFSVIESTEALVYPNEYINSITINWGFDGGGTIAGTKVDATYNYKQYEEKQSGPNKWIDITFNIVPDYAGRDFLFDFHCLTTQTGRVSVNGVPYGINEDIVHFHDVLFEDVTTISYRTKTNIYDHYCRIYYFKLVENLTPVPALLDVQVDMQVDNPDCSSIEFFKFSHKTNVSTTIDLDIWNWDTSVWFEIESVDNFADFNDDSFTLGSESDYVNASFGVRIRFQASNSINEYKLYIDRFRLDYLTTPAELEMTITSPFANYNEDLLAMNVQSWQRTNISQTITFKIWNYNTETWVQISSSSDTSFTKKEYNTTSPTNFISPTGVVKLNWTGLNITNDFELQIDYLFVQIFYKLDLVHSKSFDTNGIYRYRWCVLGSIYYTQWITFEIVDPEPNFHAISESDNPTRWLLQGAEISPIQNFTDDISGSNWDLSGVDSETFEKTFTERENYLLDNYTVSDTVLYTGTHFDVGTEDSIPEGITWDGTHFWVVGTNNDEVYKYTSVGVYTDVHFDVGTEDSTPQGICWDGTYFWVVGSSTDKVYKYNAAGVYQSVSFDVGTEDSTPTDIVWDGTYFWVVGYYNQEVYKYNAAGVYQSVSFDVGTEDTYPQGICWDGTDFWVAGYDNKEVYKYNAAGVYQSVSFDVGAQDSTPLGICWDGTDFWVVGFANTEAYRYAKNYIISKKYQGSGYMYIQTNTTEIIALRSTVYGANYTLNSGDYFEVDFQTSSDSLINLVLLRDGVVNETLTLSPSENTNLNRHTVQVSVSEDLEFDQLRISSTFEDEDYVRIYDIKTYKYTLTGDSADFYVGSNRDNKVYLTPDTYNLRISENYIDVINENVTIPATGVKQYIYTPEPSITKIECRLTLFPVGGGLSLTFEDYQTYVNRSYNGYYNEIPLLEPIFEADEFTTVYIDVYDRFDSLIGSFSEPIDDYIDLDIEVYQLEIINLMLQKTTININESHYFEIASGRWITFMLSKRYYQIGYYDPNNIYTQFLFKLDYNRVFELNMSRICNLYYTNQRMERLEFHQFKTYINGTRIINNMFYATDGEHKGIEVKDLSDISVLNHTYVEGTEELNQISLILTQYSLKIMSLQLCFNHINITRDPVHYPDNSYYWSEWIAPRETAEYFLFAGYYVINVTNYEDGGWSEYDYTLNGDDYIIIGSNNTIYNVLVNIANVNTTIGNQITNVEINITNQNSNINNTIVNIVINLDNINSTLGTILLDIDTAISNINTSIISEIVSISTELSNINSSITNEILTVSADLSNVNSSVISQLLTLGVDITNINGSIVNQIIDLGVDITNINTSLSNQILSIGVDISNLDTSITDQIVSVISNITNINTTLSTQITSLSSDISNINSTIINQIVALGVDITNINTSLSNQILSLEVDISNINTLIIEQILLVIADIENIETVIDDQTLVILSDISNTNSTLLNQMVVLGVDITNINASITNQILDLSIDLTNINSSISNLLANVEISITNLENDITTFYAFTNTSFINLNNVMNTSFINIENNIYSINQTISNLVIGVSNDIYLINGTITTMISQLETNLLLMNVSIDTALFDLGTTLNLIGSNITSNYILLNNSIYLNSLNINDSRIAIINNLLLINNTISTLVSEVYSAVYLINNSIYTAVVDLGAYLSIMNNTISGNLSIVLQMNDFLTKIYQMTMFSDLLNWTDIGLNTSLLTSQIDAWTFVNNYRNQSIEVHLRYQDLIEKLVLSADDLLEQYLPYEGVEYREWSEELQEYIGDWKELDPKNKTVNFGFFETDVPEIPEPLEWDIWTFVAFIVIFSVIGWIIVFAWSYMKREKDIVPKKTRRMYKNKGLKEGTFEKKGI